MRILVVCQYYYPEPVRIPDICEGLVAHGHEVTVLTGVPNYPMGKTYDGYTHGKHRDEMINGVHVIRTWTFPRGHDPVRRLINYYSFPVSAWIRAGHLEPVYDCVMVNQQSPVMMAWPGIRYGKKHRKPVILYCMDLWPASLTVGGIRPGTLLYKTFENISRNVYRKVDKILVTSRSFEKYLRANFDTNGAIYLPQFAEHLFDCLEPKKPDGKTTLVFAGNVGTAQGLDVVVGAVSELPDVTLHVVGDGVELENLRARARSNVVFHGRKPLESMPEYYSMADAMVVSLVQDPVLSLTLPGKVQTYMAAGRPIIGSIDGEATDVIRESGCGLCAPAGDVDGLIKTIEEFAKSDQGRKTQMGTNARRYYEEHFSREGFLTRLEKELESSIPNE